MCIKCTGNTIKSTAGNAENCEADSACDGMTTVPNENHTACGKSSFFLQSISMFLKITVK